MLTRQWFIETKFWLFLEELEPTLFMEKLGLEDRTNGPRP